MTEPFMSDPFSWPERFQQGFSREFDARRVLPVLPGWLPTDFVQHNSVVPIGEEPGRLTVAVLDSCTDDTLEKVRFILNRDLIVVVVTAEAMAYAIQRYVIEK